MEQVVDGAGGISAINYGSIKSSYNSGNIKGIGLSSMTVGGITRANQGEISSCYNEGEIYSEGNSTTVVAGGILGASYIEGSSVEKSYNIGKVIGINNKTSSYARVGGIIGDLCGNISYCYNIGEINGSGYYTHLGGVAGFLNGEKAAISESYNKGKINDDTDYTNTSLVGGIAGLNYKGSIDSSYYMEGIQGVGKTSSPGISTTYALRLEEMPEIIDIIGGEFKEDTNNINNGYPILSWQKN